jgi:hypothetical protein
VRGEQRRHKRAATALGIKMNGAPYTISHLMGAENTAGKAVCPEGAPFSRPITDTKGLAAILLMYTHRTLTNNIKKEGVDFKIFGPVVAIIILFARKS